MFEQWLEGARRTLWHTTNHPQMQTGLRRPFTTLAKKGQLSKACSALLDEPPAPQTRRRETATRNLEQKT